MFVLNQILDMQSNGEAVDEPYQIRVVEPKEENGIQGKYERIPLIPCLRNSYGVYLINNSKTNGNELQCHEGLKPFGQGVVLLCAKGSWCVPSCRLSSSLLCAGHSSSVK